tara:strand:+ start:3871 stop:6762 length:2892 start_codon:yes stop_codon:yes gene_type:complete
MQEVNELVRLATQVIVGLQNKQNRTDIDGDMVEQAFSNLLMMDMFAGLTEEEVNLAKFKVSSSFATKFTDTGAVLSDDSVPRWLDAKRGNIDWSYWKSYKDYLIKENRSVAVINKNSDIIDNILDFSGDPLTPGNWSRKGLVMGNVQSGKTQNFIGLLNKAADVGYKIIIVLGGHQNELRKQTQLRIDEGFVGLESKHLTNATTKIIGVGNFREATKVIHSFTSTLKDFSLNVARTLGYNLNDQGAAPIVLCVKKNATILKNLDKWIVENHNLEDGNTLSAPMLLIDDEADYASINSKESSNQITAINGLIRTILKRFKKTTYVGYSATPFANIFIDPATDDEMYGHDLFPANFLIRIPTPEEYSGQDYFFPENDETSSPLLEPVIKINDSEDMIPIRGQKKNTSLGDLPESLELATRCFILNIAIKMHRLENNITSEKHDTFLINMSHLNILQQGIKDEIEKYLNECKEFIGAHHGLGPEKSLQNNFLKELKDTFLMYYSIEESWEDIFEYLNSAAQKIKIFIVNAARKDSTGNLQEPLDYSLYESGLAAIAIGGHKLSRGLTLEGLSISYFARNSKSYDTLMQMCRWFGYRPGYKELCKLFTIPDSVTYYAFISDAIRDLYSELDKMIELGLTPKDFGLKIRNHPGSLIITTRNRMGTAKNKLAFIDLYGTSIKRFRFYNDEAKNRNNLSYCSDFLNDLENNGRSMIWEGDSSKVFLNVPYKKIVDFIRKMEISDDQIITNENLIETIERFSQQRNAPDFRVCLFSQRTQGAWWKEAVEDELTHNFNIGGIDVVPAMRKVSSQGSQLIPEKLNLGNNDDEKLFLEPASRKNMQESSDKSKLYSSDYIRSNERDFPGLMIYLFNLGILEPKNAKILESEADRESSEIILRNAKIAFGKGAPTIGYSLSLPILENQRDMSVEKLKELNKESLIQYMVNSVWDEQQMELFDETENDFGEDGGDE